ncbi:MAG TPA: formimidoylglutamate deiminase [Candidatus Competibacteraceae bacterium]|nr:formimidoylglutamate deiminase [Candidatus Competibacteraceae bacterium]
MKQLHAPSALLADGWANDVLICLDEQGRIAALIPGSPPSAAAERLAGPVLPGLANVHSHAFQRAMAGLTEYRGHREDSFWTWRNLMYGFLARLDPEQVQTIAAQLYVEMLKAGYTAVAEFHYLHHDPAGRPYAERAELSLRILAAAEEAGIALCHLPTLYAYGGFGAQPPSPAQRRFLHDADGFAALLETLHGHCRNGRDRRLGLAFHSLRAVDPALLYQGLAALDRLDASAPVHIHIAEQVKEVEDCLAWSGQRPVAWLLDHAPLDRRWCLVHATHLDGEETRRLAASGAVAGLCLTTEANLGDGLFPADDYLNRQPQPGTFGIGSDSHVEVDALAELRLLEYGQRLALRRRAVLASPEQPSVGRRLYQAAALGGAQAVGFDSGAITVGRRADLVVVDAQHPALWQRHGDRLLDTLVFCADRRAIRDVMVGGEWRVREGRHPREETIAARFRAVQAELAASA